MHMAVQAIIRDTGCFDVDVNMEYTELLECLEDHGILVREHAFEVGLSESNPPVALAVHGHYDLSVLIYTIPFTNRFTYMSGSSMARRLSG